MKLHRDSQLHLWAKIFISQLFRNNVIRVDETHCLDNKLCANMPIETYYELNDQFILLNYGKMVEYFLRYFSSIWN